MSSKSESETEFNPEKVILSEYMMHPSVYALIDNSFLKYIAVIHSNKHHTNSFFRWQKISCRGYNHYGP